MASSMATTMRDLQSKLLASGYFDMVDTVEPKDAPGNGFAAAVVWQAANPAGAASGLASISLVYSLMVRIYRTMFAEPPGEIDIDLLMVADELLDDVGADFDLGSSVRNVDFFGAHSGGWSVRLGYIDVSGTVYRSVDITVPVVVNDVVSAVSA